MTKTEERQKSVKLANDILEQLRSYVKNDEVLFLVSMELGKGHTDYLRVMATYKGDYGPNISHLTWAVGKAFEYSLRDRKGRWFLALGGGGYSKPDEVARCLAYFYNVERLKYEVI
jgi:hypothetical protein